MKRAIRLTAALALGTAIAVYLAWFWISAAGLVGDAAILVASLH